MSNKVPLGKKRFKYVIHWDAKEIKPLYIFAPKITAYRKDFDETKYVSFLTTYDRLLEKYKEIWDKASHTIGKEIDSNPV